MYKLQILPNNLKLITASVAGTKTATVLVIIGTGSKYENKTNNGISHFLEHMFFKGTTRRPTALAIASELDRLGGEYNAFTSKEYTGLWVKVEASRLEEATAVLSDIIFNSKMLEEEIEREKNVIIEELNMYLDNPLIYVENLFEQCLYGNTPAGWDTIGRKENILKFKRKDLVNYLRSQVAAGNCLVCLTGNISGLDTVKLINKYFSGFSPGAGQEKQAVAERQRDPKVKFYFKKTDQAHLCLGVRGYAFGYLSEVVLRVIAVLLGGSMSSRLFINLRERRGLAYYVRTQVETYTDCGYLVTQAGVPLDKVGHAIKIILDECKKLRNTPVLKHELDKVKQYLIGRTALQLEASDNVASWYGRQAIMTMKQEGNLKHFLSKSAVKDFDKSPCLPRKRENCGQALPPPVCAGRLSGGLISREIFTPDQYYNELNKVKREDILKVARQIFVNDKLNLAVIGPFKNEEEFKRILRF